MATEPSTDAVLAALTSEEREQIEGLLDEDDRDAREHPLAYADLWHREPPRTSQRQAVRDLLDSGQLVMLLAGANRSGKSHAAAQVAVAFAQGRENADVQAWCARNSVPPEVIPTGPGDVWAVALDSGDSLEYQRPAIERYLPAGCKWRNREGPGRATVTLPGRGRLGFKSLDEGRDGFQGTAKRLIWIDEEPWDRGVVDECLMRLVDERGRLLISMTPLSGLTWVYDRWVADPAAPSCVRTIWGVDNPYVPEDYLRQLLESYGPHERAARERGEWTAVEGRIYTDWRRDLHVLEPPERRDGWTTVIGIDPGTRNPCAILVGLHDPADDVVWIVEESYEREKSYTDHVATLGRLQERWGEASWIVCDPEDRGFRVALAREGIATMKARKQVRAGISAVADRLRPDANGRPHLVVSPACRHTIREIEGYVWRTSESRSDAPDAPLKAADHAMDALRYLVMGIRQSDIFGQ